MLPILSCLSERTWCPTKVSSWAGCWFINSSAGFRKGFPTSQSIAPCHDGKTPVFRDPLKESAGCFPFLFIPQQNTHKVQLYIEKRAPGRLFNFLRYFCTGTTLPLFPFACLHLPFLFSPSLFRPLSRGSCPHCLPTKIDHSNLMKCKQIEGK